MPSILHEAASRKGGKVRKPKGLSSLSSERRKEVASMGGKQLANNRKNSIKIKEDTNIHGTLMEELLGALDETKL